MSHDTRLFPLHISCFDGCYSAPGNICIENFVIILRYVFKNCSIPFMRFIHILSKRE
jgi:hypothetical protein